MKTVDAAVSDPLALEARDVASEISRLVRSDERAAAIELLADFHCQNGATAPVAAHHWARARRIALAEEHLPWSARDWTGRGLLVSASELSAEQARLGGGDRAERALARVLGYSDLSLRRSEVAADAAQVLARARAIVRDPGRYAAERVGQVRRSAHLVASIEALPAALLRLTADRMGVPQLSESPVEGGRENVLLLRLPTIRSAGQVIQIDAFVSLGHSRGPLGRQTTRERLLALGLEPLWQLITLAGPFDIARENLHVHPYPPDPLMPPAEAQSVLGRDGCAHTNGEWIPTNDGVPGALALRLSCADCLRERAGIVLAHQLPAEHPLRCEIRAESYLAAERYRRSMVGSSEPVPGSLSRLTAQAGALASLDLARWAAGRPERTAARHRRRDGDLVSVLAGRRRP